MPLKPWNPWEELERIQTAMDLDIRSFLIKLRQAVPGNPIAFVPPIDVVESADEYQLYLALPGMVEEDIDITLEGRQLIIRGEREPLYEPGEVTVHQAQGKYGFFERRLELPEAVSSEGIQAGYDAGMLSIRVPKTKPAARGDAVPGDAVPDSGNEGERD